jgi:F-type H+-transporting ATPase subunit epsilon
MADTFKLKVLIPSGIALEAEVEAVTLPTELGECGILPGHAKFTSLLSSGVMSVQGIKDQQNSNSSERRMVISGGFLSFNDNQLEIIADSLDTLESIDRATYSNKRNELEKLLADKPTFDPDYLSARAQISRIDAIDLLLSHASKGSLN